MGSKGAYLNTGIPGTGLYDRTKIGGSTSKSKTRSLPTSSYIELSVTIGIDDNGNNFVKDQHGQLITDESLLRKIKRTDVYKNKIQELSEKFVNEKNDKTIEFVEIYKQSEKLLSESEIHKKLENLAPKKYIKKKFSYPKPDEISIKEELACEAKRNIRSIAFWTLNKRRNEYINKEFPARLQEAQEAYKNARIKHDLAETMIENEKNTEYENIYNNEKAFWEDCLLGKKEFVEPSIDFFLNGMTLPVEFEVSYEYDESKGTLKVDLDLPEIEDLPQSKATTLASGKVKIKGKTQKEIKEEYLICTTGLAFFFASKFFNISTHIEKILISGFTQRISKKTGQLGDEYIYSVIFDRNKFQKIEISKIIPYLAFEEFEHKINYSKTFDTLTIEPIFEIN